MIDSSARSAFEIGEKHRILDANRIARRLWQGGCPRDIGTPTEDFTLHVHCAAGDSDLMRARTAAYPSVRHLYAPIADSELTEPEFAVVERAAAEVVAAWERGGRILVTCHMGLNRSGLVMALVLFRLAGWPSDRLIRHIQSARSGSLFNESFLRAIRGTDRWARVGSTSNIRALGLE